MLDTSRRVTSARRKTREGAEKIPQVLNQTYGLIKRGSRVKTIMVLSLMTMRSLRIHRQKDMISWTWLSSCLKALLAGPGFRFLIFKPQRCSFFGFFFGLLCHCSSFILTAATSGFLQSSVPFSWDCHQIQMETENDYWTIFSAVLSLPAYSIRLDLPVSKVKNDPLISLLAH